MSNSIALIQPMTEGDLDAVMTIQAAAYQESLREGREIFEQRLTFYKDGCRMALFEDRPVGYLISHPWRLDTAPDLNRPLEQSGVEPDGFYIHDTAVNAPQAPKGTGSALAQTALCLAQQSGYTALLPIAQ